MSKIYEGTSGSSITITKIFEHPSELSVVKSPVAYSIPSSTVIEATGDLYTNAYVSTTQISTDCDLTNVGENYSVKIVDGDGLSYYGLVSSVTESDGTYTVTFTGTTVPVDSTIVDIFIYSAKVNVAFYTKTMLSQTVYDLSTEVLEDTKVEFLTEPGYAIRINSLVWQYTVNIPSNMRSFTGFVEWKSTFTDENIQEDAITLVDVDTVMVIAGGSSNPDDMASSANSEDFAQNVSTDVERPKRVRTRGVDGSEYEVEYENTAEAIASRQRAQAALISSVSKATAGRTGGIYKQHRLNNSYVNDPVLRGVAKNSTPYNITQEEMLEALAREAEALKNLELKYRGYR